MMSEEEDSEAGDSEFIRHRPQWRSHQFNRFINKLDKRFKSKHAKSLAKPRSYGSPNSAPAPMGVPSWMTLEDMSALAAVRDSEFEDPLPLKIL